jgi:hypothetical protein
MKMKACTKRIGVILASAVIFGTMAMPAYAAKGKDITSVKIKVDAHIQPETRFGDEEIEIETTSSSRYSYDYYEIENFGSTWEEDDTPEITIYLSSEEGYGFSLSKASAVTVTGATYVSASKADYESGSGYRTLKVKVQLPPMEEQVDSMGAVTLTDGGYAYWDEVRGAGSYQLRFYRNGTALGATETMTTDTMYNLQTVMNRAGSYSVKVRACNKIKPENKSDWIESNVITLTTEQANRVREGVAPERPVRGQWMYDNTGGWWYQMDDGTYPKNNWMMIGDRWYFFDENGYMKTGWIEWEGKEYYCKDGSGEMLRNTTTPDGYILDENGTKKTGR